MNFSFKGQPKFKQALKENLREPGKLLATLMVPIQLVCIIKGKLKVIYHNWRCNSPKSVR